MRKLKILLCDYSALSSFEFLSMSTKRLAIGRSRCQTGSGSMWVDSLGFEILWFLAVYIGVRIFRSF